MGKKTPVESRAAKRKTLYRCVADNTVLSTEHEYSRRFGPGQIVDLDEPIGGGLKLRDVVRDGCFVPLEESEEGNGA